MKNKRIVWLDFIRVLAMIMVVMLHVMGNTINTFSLVGKYKTIYEILISIFNISVPLFVMISGYLFLNPKKKISFSEMFKKYILKIILIILIFGIVFITIEEVFINKTLDKNIFITILTRLINGDIWAHMWYLYMILGLYLITPFLKKIIDNIDKKELLILLILLYILSIFIPNINSILNLNIDFYMPISCFILYYCLGYYLGTIDLKKIFKNSIYIFSCILVIYIILSNIFNLYILNSAYSSTFTLLLATGLFLSIKDVNFKQNNKWIYNIANASLGIYIVHQFFINIIYKLLKIDIILSFPIMGLLIYTLVIIILSYVTTYVLKKIPFIKNVL